MTRSMHVAARHLRSAYMRVRAVFTHRARERDLAEELELHLIRATEQHESLGMTPANARAAALRAFGNVESIKAHSRDARGTRWIDEIRQDTRYAIRDVMRRPAFAVLVILTLAAGIGVNSSVFSVLNLLFQPIAVPDAASIVSLARSNTTFRFRNQFSLDDVRLLRASVPALRGIVGSSGLIPVVFSRRGAESIPRDAFVSFVTDDYFSLLGGRIIQGRAILASDNASDGVSPVAVLSERFWRNEYGGDAQVVGQTVVVSGVAFQVVGIANEAFAGEGFELRTPELWVPAMMRAAMWRGNDSTASVATYPWLDVTARLAPGVSIGRATLELGALNQRIAQRNGVPDSVVRLSAYRPSALGNVSFAERAGAASIGMLLPLLILLIACANLTNVMLTRAASRQHEFGVRLSLGASRGRIIRQLLVESTLLAMAGAVVGLLLTRVLIALLAVRLFESFGHRDPLTAASRVAIDSHVLLGTMIVAIGTIIVVGLVPALRATRVDLSTIIKSQSYGSTGGSAKSRLRDTLVVCQVACSAVCLLIAGSFARTAARTGDADVGFDASHVVVARVSSAITGSDSASARAFRSDMVERLTLIPAIADIAETLQVPFEGIMIEQASPEHSTAAQRLHSVLTMHVSSNYFRVMGTTFVSGRTFEPNESVAEPSVTVVSEALAAAMWPGENALGKRIKSTTSETGQTVIGVVKNVSLSVPGESFMPVMYSPLPKSGNTVGESGWLVIKTVGSAESAASTIQSTIRGYDAKVYSSVYPLSVAITKSEFVRASRSFAAGATALGTLALLLAAVGLYSVAAFAVSERTREIGIRMALGARSEQVMRESLWRIGKLTMWGLGIGVSTGVFILLVLRALLSGLAPFSALAFVGVIALLVLTALVAAWAPARRASRIDPMVALRGG